MKLIKISDRKIIDMDTATLYSTHKATDDHGNKIFKVFMTQPSGEGIEFNFSEATNLWAYLEENASNESWRTE